MIFSQSAFLLQTISFSAGMVVGAVATYFIQKKIDERFFKEYIDKNISTDPVKELEIKKPKRKKKVETKPKEELQEVKQQAEELVKAEQELKEMEEDENANRSI